MKRFLKLLPAMLLAVAGGASAQSTWSFTSGTSDSGCLQNAGTTTSVLQNCSASGTTATLDGFGFSAATTGTGSASAYARASITDQNSSGIGMAYSGESTTSPQHAIDANTQREVLVLTFSEAVRMSQLHAGWIDTAYDADIQVYKWVGCSGCTAPTAFDSSTSNTATPTNTLNSLAGSLTAGQGWELVKTADMELEGQTVNITATTNVTASSWWLISAYMGSSSGNFNQGDDYFKLASVSACASSHQPAGAGTPCGAPTTSKTPEPMSAALVGMALLGGFGARRLQRRG